ncbi:MAG TPA: S9 family peptidase [Acidobacteriaceae bacterium]
MLLKRSLACVAVALSLSVIPALAQRDMPGVHMPGNVALSPDGATVAWTLRSHGGSTLHLSPASAPASVETAKTISVPNATGCAYGEPIWSPDGQTLAFLGACAPESADPTVPRQSQIYLWAKSTGEVKQLTHVTGDINQPAWSPDGKSIAFLFVENATRTAGALDAMKPWSGVIGEDGVEVQRVYAVNASSGSGLFTTAANLHVYEFDWAPDSNHLAFIAANPPGENNWWVAKLYTTTLTSVPQPGHPVSGVCVVRPNSNDTCPETVRVVFDPQTTHSALHGLQIAVPRYSPDGKRIAFIGGLMSDQGSTGGDIWTINADGKGAPTDITPGIDGTPTWEAWINNHTVGFVEDRSGHILLTDADADAHHVVPNSSDDLGEVMIGGGGPIKNAIAASNNGVIAYVLYSYNKAPEIYVGAPGKATQFTHLNSTADLHPPRFESLEWENEGFHVQGWLTFPKDFDPTKTYPLIVEVHGGPSASAGPRPDTMFSEAGYFVLSPNPRGSFGQGEAFTKANIKDFGYGDLRDILKGMDTVEAKYPIDKHREGITGWSYGGFMTMFAVTQTHRFRAAVAGAGLSDWLSYYGENSIDQWMIPFFGASVYDDPAVYAKSSAITFIKNVKTPTLVIVGDRDGECPAPQSFEFWHALRDLGVKTQLVVYPDEGHGFRNPAHIADERERMLKWFADNMPASPGVQTAQK